MTGEFRYNFATNHQNNLSDRIVNRQRLQIAVLSKNRRYLGCYAWNVLTAAIY
jgi:hypothetical protein